jgi:hypothetical protein
MIRAEETTEIIGLAMHCPIVHDYSMDVTTQVTWDSGVQITVHHYLNTTI